VKRQIPRAWMDGGNWLPSPGGPFAALVIAHPGHELRLHGWLERVRPRVFVLTDGSGHSGLSRLASTTRILAGAGAEPGSVYGRFSDRDLYATLLDGKADVFVHLAEELAGAFAQGGVGYVVSDALEGYNPAHDICRLVTGAAVPLARRASRRPLAGFDFPLVERPDACPDDLRPGAVWTRLDAGALARKLAAARSYPEMAAEVSTALGTWGVSTFAVECLRPADGLPAATPPGGGPPFTNATASSEQRLAATAGPSAVASTSNQWPSVVGGKVPVLLPSTHGRRVCQSVARSNRRAARSSLSSSKGAASSCRPMGRPSLLKPHGRLMPGRPARLQLIV
jgi:AcrR family transcriptional regulator